MEIILPLCWKRFLKENAILMLMTTEGVKYIMLCLIYLQLTFEGQFLNFYLIVLTIPEI